MLSCHGTHRTASPSQNTQKVLEKGRASIFSVFSVPRDTPQKTKFSEGRLRSNGEAARKGPRGFSVFSGENDGGGSLPQMSQIRASPDTDLHRCD